MAGTLVPSAAEASSMLLNRALRVDVGEAEGVLLGRESAAALKFGSEASEVVPFVSIAALTDVRSPATATLPPRIATPTAMDVSDGALMTVISTPW